MRGRFKGTRKASTKKKPSKKKTSRKISSNKSKSVNKKAVSKKKAPGQKKTPGQKNRDDLVQNLDHKYVGRGGKWIIVQLSESCELKEHAEQLVQQIKEAYGEKTEFFLPMYVDYVGNKSVCLVLFDGYFFVRETKELDTAGLKERTEFIQGPMYKEKQMKYVKNKDINKFKNDIKKKLKTKIPKKGQLVIPKVGNYRNIEGKVISVNRKKMVARVVFSLVSRVVEAPIKIINLDIME